MPPPPLAEGSWGEAAAVPARPPPVDAPRLRTVALHSPLAGPFDLELSRSECLAITGPSGSGKSLLLRMIADLDPGTGEVLLDGVERRTLPAPAWRRQVVYNAAEPGWWSERVADHFPGETMRFAREMAPRLALAPGLLDGLIVQLSTGERQRVALIRALALHPPLLLLDEATGALDEASTALVEAVLRERLADGAALVLVTHSTAQAARLGHSHQRMENRRLVPA